MASLCVCERRPINYGGQVFARHIKGLIHRPTADAWLSICSRAVPTL